MRALLASGLLALLCGCASLPPGSEFPKTASSALTRPEQTRMGRQLAEAKAEHPGTSGFRLLPVGIESFVLRMELAAAAERTLDVQYFVIQSDDTGQLLIEALLKAADRGVRVRVLLDDSGSFGRDAQIRTLAGYPNVELRLFNPFAYRGDVEFVHVAEFLGNASRLNYRMHNKVFVVDNEIGIVGGRNIGDEYFQGGRDFEFGDYDIIAAGPIINEVSKSFDAFWNSPMAIPIEALFGGTPSREDLSEYRGVLAAHHAQMIEAGAAYMRTLAAGEPLASMLSGSSRLVWARAEVIYDSPEKAKVEDGEQGGRLLRTASGRSGEAGQIGTDRRVALPRARARRNDVPGGVARAQRQRAHTDQFARVDRHVRRSLRLSGVPRAAAGNRRRPVRSATGARPAGRSRQPVEIAEFRHVCVARQGVRVRSYENIRRLDEPRSALFARQYRSRPDHRQPRARATGCAALRGYRTAGQQLCPDAGRRGRRSDNVISYGARWRTECRSISTRSRR